MAACSTFIGFIEHIRINLSFIIWQVSHCFFQSMSYMLGERRFAQSEFTNLSYLDSKPSHFHLRPF